MSQYLRYLVTVDSASGVPVKVEQVGEGGDLKPVDFPVFMSSLGAGPGNSGAQPQIVVNIYGAGAAPGTTAGLTAQASSAPVAVYSAPPPVAPPPNRPRKP